MTEYYQGHIAEHARFWAGYRELDVEKRFSAFISFFYTTMQEVDDGKTRLRDAGYALEPGYYDDAIQADPHGGDMTIFCLLASNLAAWNYESREEAEADWHQMAGIMKQYHALAYMPNDSPTSTYSRE
jgi:hypothetical protein